jgi:hypothetical protein
MARTLPYLNNLISNKKIKATMDQIRDLENMIENVRKNFSLVSKLDDKIGELAKQVVRYFISYQSLFE